MKRVARAGSDRYEALDALFDELDRLEEAHARLSVQRRTPPIEQAFIGKCLQVIEFHRAKAHLRKARLLGEHVPDIPRFTRMVINAFDKSKAGQKDPYRTAIKAYAAAILESARSDAQANEEHWAANIANELFDAGMSGRKKRKTGNAPQPPTPYTPSNVKKWRDEFIKWEGASRERLDHAPQGAKQYHRHRHRLFDLFRLRKNSADNLDAHLLTLESELKRLITLTRSFIGPQRKPLSADKVEGSEAEFCLLMFGMVLTPEQLEKLS